MCKQTSKCLARSRCLFINVSSSSFPAPSRSWPMVERQSTLGSSSLSQVSKERPEVLVDSRVQGDGLQADMRRQLRSWVKGRFILSLGIREGPVSSKKASQPQGDPLPHCNPRHLIAIGVNGSTFARNLHIFFHLGISSGFKVISAISCLPPISGCRVFLEGVKRHRVTSKTLKITCSPRQVHVLSSPQRVCH